MRHAEGCDECRLHSSKKDQHSKESVAFAHGSIKSLAYLLAEKSSRAAAWACCCVSASVECWQLCMPEVAATSSAVKSLKALH